MTVGSGNLLARLTELHEKAPPETWAIYASPHGEQFIVYKDSGISIEGPRMPMSREDQELAVAARNALPAVLSLITAAQQLAELPPPLANMRAAAAQCAYMKHKLAAALAPFIEED